MNRLILLGNGFDLAHGLKTSYKDFIFWYLDECFNNAGIYANGHFYEDEFIRVEVREHYRLMELGRKAGKTGISRYLYDKGELGNYLNYNNNANSLNDYYKKIFEVVSNISGHYVTIKSFFFESLIESCLECGWVDIEQEYFKALNSCKSSNGLFDYKKVIDLNKNFYFLKQKLEEYLILQDKNFDGMFNSQLGEILGQDFQEDDFDPTFGDNELRIMLGKDYSSNNNKIQRSVYVLNFNYTNTFYNYLKEIKGNYFTKVEINHIHGQLNNKDNPIIFGFGDEHDKDYASYEEQSNNALFEHVKSYHYLKTPNYRNLIRFLNQDFYQVLVVGHSCGLSDRTMFKEIFDHENCKSVKILHHKRDDGTTDFFDKTINLGRHFSDKGRMRKLVVNFNEADAVPQLKKLI